MTTFKVVVLLIITVLSGFIRCNLVKHQLNRPKGGGVYVPLNSLTLNTFLSNATDEKTLEEENGKLWWNDLQKRKKKRQFRRMLRKIVADFLFLYKSQPVLAPRSSLETLMTRMLYSRTTASKEDLSDEQLIRVFLKDALDPVKRPEDRNSSSGAEIPSDQWDYLQAIVSQELDAADVSFGPTRSNNKAPFKFSFTSSSTPKTVAAPTTKRGYPLKAPSTAPRSTREVEVKSTELKVLDNDDRKDPSTFTTTSSTTKLSTWTKVTSADNKVKLRIADVPKHDNDNNVNDDESKVQKRKNSNFIHLGLNPLKDFQKFLGSRKSNPLISPFLFRFPKSQSNNRRKQEEAEENRWKPPTERKKIKKAPYSAATSSLSQTFAQTSTSRPGEKAYLKIKMIHSPFLHSYAENHLDFNDEAIQVTGNLVETKVDDNPDYINPSAPGIPKAPERGYYPGPEISTITNDDDNKSETKKKDEDQEVGATVVFEDHSPIFSDLQRPSFNGGYFHQKRPIFDSVGVHFRRPINKRRKNIPHKHNFNRFQEIPHKKYSDINRRRFQGAEIPNPIPQNYPSASGNVINRNRFFPSSNVISSQSGLPHLKPNYDVIKDELTPSRRPQFITTTASPVTASNSFLITQNPEPQFETPLVMTFTSRPSPNNGAGTRFSLPLRPSQAPVNSATQGLKPPPVIASLFKDELKRSGFESGGGQSIESSGPIAVPISLRMHGNLDKYVQETERNNEAPMVVNFDNGNNNRREDPNPNPVTPKFPSVMLATMFRHRSQSMARRKMTTTTTATTTTTTTTSTTFAPFVRRAGLLVKGKPNRNYNANSNYINNGVNVEDLRRQNSILIQLLRNSLNPQQPQIHRRTHQSLFRPNNNNNNNRRCCQNENELFATGSTHRLTYAKPPPTIKRTYGSSSKLSTANKSVNNNNNNNFFILSPQTLPLPKLTKRRKNVQ